MWESMSRLYHTQWTRTNGEVGGPVFQDWCRELLPYGSDGVLRGLQSVRDAGSAYLPPLSKFLSYCRSGGAENFSPDFGPWETCPYTGRRRRLRLTEGWAEVAERFETESRTNQQIRSDIESMIAAGRAYNAIDADGNVLHGDYYEQELVP